MHRPETDPILLLRALSVCRSQTSYRFLFSEEVLFFLSLSCPLTDPIGSRSTSSGRSTFRGGPIFLSFFSNRSYTVLLLVYTSITTLISQCSVFLMRLNVNINVYRMFIGKVTRGTWLASSRRWNSEY